MNLFEFSFLGSGAAGLAAGIAVGAKAGKVALIVSAPLGLALGIGGYFGLMALGTFFAKRAGLDGTEKETTFAQECAAGFLLGAGFLSPIVSGLLAAIIVQCVVSYVIP